MGAFAARNPYSNTAFGLNKGTITNGVFKVTDSNTGTEMTITNASYVAYYNPSGKNYYKPYLRLSSSSSSTTITFKFTDPALSLHSISYETNTGYSSWWGGYNNTYTFGVSRTTGIENFTESTDGLTWSCTFSGVDNIQIMSVGFWWDPIDEIMEHAPTGVTKSYTGTSQSLFDLNSTYYAKSGTGNGEIGYKCKYNKSNVAALSMLFAGGQGTEKLYKGYATDVDTYTIKWWYEGNSFRFSDVDVMYTKPQGSETAPLGTFSSEITPMVATDVIEPSAKLLDYTGEPQALVTAASSPNGKAYYKLSTESAWQESIPTGTDAGDYVVYWYMESTNSAYENIGSMLDPNGPIVVSIRKVDITTSPTPPTPLTPVYNTQEQSLVSGGEATGGEIWYRVGDDGTWKQTATASQVGPYRVYWYVKGDENHNDLGSETSPYGNVTTEIQKASYNMSAVKWTNALFTYDGTAKQGGVTVSQLPSPDISTTYTYKDANNNEVTEAVNAGTYTVIASFTTSSSNYVNPSPISTTLTIEPFNLQGAYADSEIPDQEYIGGAIAPVSESSPVLRLKPAGLVIPYSAYTATYLNNVNAGTKTATATLTANNSDENYVGSKALRFSITKKSVRVSTEAQSITYGETISSNTDKATLSGAVMGHELSAVTLRPYENYGIGTHENAIVASDVHINDGSGNDVTANYDITCPESLRGTLTVAVKAGGGFTISGLQAEYEGDGTTAVTPDVSSMAEVAVYDGATKLTKGTDYTVSYTNNIVAGTATATFTFQGNYEGSVSQDFVIYYLAETFSRQSAPQYNYCTYYHPSEALHVTDANAKVYYCTLNGDKTEVVLNEVTAKVINAGTPVMLSTPSTTKSVKLYAYSGDDAVYSGTNALTGVSAVAAIDPESKTYIFDGDDFVWAHKGNLALHKAYVDGADKELARQRLSIAFGDSEATSINNCELNESGRDAWYDLMGNRIDCPTRKGLYILNGKKVVVK